MIFFSGQNFQIIMRQAGILFFDFCVEAREPIHFLLLLFFYLPFKRF